MRKIFGVLVVLAILFMACEVKESATARSDRNNEAIAQQAAQSFPTPMVKNFIERKTVRAWVERWDTPMIITYIYLFANNSCIGYFVCDGKPASTMSYLEPEERYYMNGATLQTPSLDGTFGSDQPGWVFFTSDGTAVSWQGGSANILFSDAPLPALNAPSLGKLQGTR